MLASLTIQNIVLIERLTLEGGVGLCALTGETGAGKSILLDALGLALGGRADAGLVRHGTEQASVTASFDLPKKHRAHKMLQEKDIPADEGLILRRVVAKDGRSKAFVNDAPVTVQFLKELGAELIEIHGQFDTQGLMDAATHRAALDAYAGTSPDAQNVSKLWRQWQDTLAQLEQARKDAQNIQAQEDYLRHAVAELQDLDVQSGEEDILAEKRRILIAHEKAQDVFEDAENILENETGLLTQMGRLEGLVAKLPDAPDLQTAINRAKSEIEDISWQLGKLKNGDAAGDSLAKIEDRYFAVRAMAKKHRSLSDDLPALLESLSQKLRLITHADETLADLEKAVQKAKGVYLDAAGLLSSKRKKAAEKLGKLINGELPDLKLDKAKFDIACAALENENQWGEHGIDKIQFMVSTNPQTPAGPLHKIASGGELSRFMLALKVILAETGSVPTLIFDEADSGIGGATADAVGERLQRLAKKYQVFAVTHSPQVAARAAQHWHVAKTDQKGAVLTHIIALSNIKERQEEIARMLSGAEITPEARAQAAKLLEKNAAA